MPHSRIRQTRAFTQQTRRCNCVAKHAGRTLGVCGGVEPHILAPRGLAQQVGVWVCVQRGDLRVGMEEKKSERLSWGKALLGPRNPTLEQPPRKANRPAACPLGNDKHAPAAADPLLTVPGGPNQALMDCTSPSPSTQ